MTIEDQMRLLAAAARSGARDAGSSDRGARAPAEDDARRGRPMPKPEEVEGIIAQRIDSRAS